MKKSWLPCLLTLLNLLSGLFSLIFILKGRLIMAVVMFASAAFFDSVDGRVARRLDAVSELGKELDSLSDLLSFGVVPALILYQVIARYNFKFDIIEFIFPAIYIICGALRLARYNILNIKQHFLGMPIPVAGSLLLIAIFSLKDFSYLVIAASLIISILMVSSFKFPRLWA